MSVPGLPEGKAGICPHHYGKRRYIEPIVMGGWTLRLKEELQGFSQTIVAVHNQRGAPEYLRKDSLSLQGTGTTGYVSTTIHR